jgi:hypothetical protein
MNEDRPSSCQQCAALRAELDKVRRERDALRERRAAGALFRAMLERAIRKREREPGSRLQ